jgi:general secretion pathway protein J
LFATFSGSRAYPFECRRGFTLIEILIATVILGVITAALYGSYFTVLRAREWSALGMEARRELGSTLDLVRREIDSSVYNRGDKRLRFVVEDRDIFGKPASSLELTTLAPPSHQPHKESGIVNVRYRLAEKEKRLILTRREQDSMLESAETADYPQMERISSFLVECHDGSKWVRSWNTELNMALPRKIRITVQVEEDGKPLEFSVLSAPQATGL